ncbi:MAG: hypothetical protein ACP5IL_12075 [Syntrophobacteraceae bacterium]
MDEELVSSLTRQVKEEVVGNYLLERRLLELQIEHLHSLAGSAIRHAQAAGLRLARISSLMIEPGMRQRLEELLGLEVCGFWGAYLSSGFMGHVRFIRARALTKNAKFRKLILESYSRLHSRMSGYEQEYGQIVDECSAVNSNIVTFQKNFDLLGMINFLKSLDTAGLERKKILGENFTAQEISALDQSLYVGPVSVEKLNIPFPLHLPPSDAIRGKLSNLADEVFARYPEKVSKILL